MAACKMQAPLPGDGPPETQVMRQSVVRQGACIIHLMEKFFSEELAKATLKSQSHVELSASQQTKLDFYPQCLSRGSAGQILLGKFHTLLSSAVRGSPLPHEADSGELHVVRVDKGADGDQRDAVEHIVQVLRDNEGEEEEWDREAHHH